MISDILYKISIGELISEDEQREMKIWFDNLQNAPEQLSSMFKGLPTISTLSQIATALGTVNRGNFLSGDDGDYLDTTGNNPFTGVGMISPGLTVGTDQAAIFGMNTGVLQFWLSALTGKIMGGKGSVEIFEDGIIITEGGDAIKFRNSTDGYAVLSMPASNFRLVNYIKASGAVSLISNGDFETGSFSSWTETDATSKLSVEIDSGNLNNYVFKIASGATSSNYLQQNLSTSKEKFMVSFRAKTDNADVAIWFTNNISYARSVTVYGNNDWRNYEIFYNTQDTGAVTYLKVYATPGASTNVYIDDITVLALDGHSEIELNGGTTNTLDLKSSLVRYGQTPSSLGWVYVRDGAFTTPGGLNLYFENATLSGGAGELQPYPFTGVFRLNATAATDVTGIDYDYGVGTLYTAAAPDRYLPLFNIGTAVITLKHEDTGATAANRFTFPSSKDVYIKPGHSVTVWRDNTSSRWRLAGTSLQPKAETNANDIFRVDSPGGASTFVGTIATLPGGATLTYNVTSGNEGAMVPTSTSQLGKMRLYNTTRGTSALISNCVTGTNTITLTANVPAGWQTTDVITIASQTVVGGLDWVDIEITSGEFLSKSYVGLYIAHSDSGGAGYLYAAHPFETYANSKIVVYSETKGTTLDTKQWAYYKLVSNVVTLAWTASAGTVVFAVREAGYLE